MSENDLRELRALLREAVGVLRRPTRQLEREIGVGNGRLQQLLDGTLELRVHHLLSFARLLRIPPEDLLAYSCSETRAAARHRLPNWLRYLDKNRPDEAASSKEPEQLREMIRGVLREELEQRAAAVSEPAPRGRRKSES